MKAACKTVKVFALAVALIATALFAGCDAGVSLYEARGEDGWYFALDVSVDSALESELHANAAYSDKLGKEWTLGDWLYDYFGLTSEIYGYEFKYDGVRNEKGGRRVYGFYDIFVPDKTLRGELSDGLTLEGETDVTTNLFMRTVRVVRDGRFDFWIRSLEDAVSSGDSGEGGKTLMGMILYGVGHYETKDGELTYVEDLPGFTTAFGVPLNGYTEMLLTDFWLASKKMNVACDAKLGTDDSKNVYYVFNRRLGDEDEKVEYEYFRADPTGWYLVAIAAGGAAVGIGILAANIIKRRKDKKPKPTVRDNFPYDPFDGNIDPFA